MSEVEIIKSPASSDNEGGQKEENNYKKAGSAIKKSAWMAFAESMALVILGVFLIAWPEVVIKVIAYAVGAFLALKGGYKIINYYLSKGHKNYFNNDLLFGTISVLAGITIMVLGEGIANAFRIVVGIWIIYEALVRLNTTMKLNSANIPAWRYTLIIALLMLILGVFVTFTDGAIAQLIGGMMIASGVIGVIGDVMFMQYVGVLVEKLTHFNK